MRAVTRPPSTSRSVAYTALPQTDFASDFVSVQTIEKRAIGKQMNEMVQAYKDGDIKKAMELHQKYLPVMTGIFCTVNPTPIKACCNMLGLPAGAFRLPMVDASPKVKEFLTQMMKDAGVM